MPMPAAQGPLWCRSAPRSAPAILSMSANAGSESSHLSTRHSGARRSREPGIHTHERAWPLGHSRKLKRPSALFSYLPQMRQAASAVWLWIPGLRAAHASRNDDVEGFVRSLPHPVAAVIFLPPREPAIAELQEQPVVMVDQAAAALIAEREIDLVARRPGDILQRLLQRGRHLLDIHA